MNEFWSLPVQFTAEYTHLTFSSSSFFININSWIILSSIFMPYRVALCFSLYRTTLTGKGNKWQDENWVEFKIKQKNLIEIWQRQATKARYWTCSETWHKGQKQKRFNTIKDHKLPPLGTLPPNAHYAIWRHKVSIVPSLFHLKNYRYGIYQFLTFRSHWVKTKVILCEKQTKIHCLFCQSIEWSTDDLP